jgi:hypothetical protein
MSSNDLIPYINMLKEEILNYYSSWKKYYLEKNPQRKDLRKDDIEESFNKINLINQYIKKSIENYKKLANLNSEINKEKRKKEKLEKKSKKLNDFIEKGKKILNNNIPYLGKIDDYSDKKLKIAKLSPLDLINLTLRVNQQYKAPPENISYLNNYLSNANSQKNEASKDDFNLHFFYIKNKNRFLAPYPGMLDEPHFSSPSDNNRKSKKLENSILRYDFSEEKRLLPPILEYPDPKNINENGEIIANKGSQIKLKSPEGNPTVGIFFKYSKNSKILPSFFSGEKYESYKLPDLDIDCVFKVCTCKKGYKDSKIITFKFSINYEKEDIYITKNVGKESNNDVMTNVHDQIDTPDSELVFKSHYSESPNENSSHNTYRPGTSKLDPVYFDSDKFEGEEDEDEI